MRQLNDVTRADETDAKLTRFNGRSGKIVHDGFFEVHVSSGSSEGLPH